MPLHRDELSDMMAFLAVAEERSFTRAAARLKTSQSALSHVVRRLEERLDVRLLTRTTRSVIPTEAGEKLVATLRPAFNRIEEQLSELDAYRSAPSGTIRITAPLYAAHRILLPVVSRLMMENPALNFEISTDQRFVDIVKDGFDAGVRLGEAIEKDMIATRIGPDLCMRVVGSPDYFDRNPVPQTPQDLIHHNCNNLRLPTLGGLYVWEFERDGRPMNVRVDGQFTTNDPESLVLAALDGLGLTFLPDDHLEEHLQSGRLVSCLVDWCPPFQGVHLYYPSRRQALPAFKLLTEALRYRGQ